MIYEFVQRLLRISVIVHFVSYCESIEQRTAYFETAFPIKSTTAAGDCTLTPSQLTLETPLPWK